jgi:hypothetical protein
LPEARDAAQTPMNPRNSWLARPAAV